MTQERYQHTQNGQEVQEDDLNLLGNSAGFADDRILSEIYRFTPYDGAVYKAIIPYGVQYANSTSTPLLGTLSPGGADGTVRVNPFRAVIGSRALASAGATDNWDGIRSSVFISSPTGLQETIHLAANSSGSTKWALIYAAVSIDQSGSSVTRKIKNPTTSNVTSVSLAVSLVQNIAIGAVYGTSKANALTSFPADSGSTYNIILGYVRQPNGFGSSTTVPSTNICDASTVLTLSPVTGANTSRPANQNYIENSSNVVGTQWDSTTGHRPAFYLPPSMVGSETLYIAIDNASSSSTNFSHTSHGVIDSRDWRGRIVDWVCQMTDSSATFFGWDPVVGTGFRVPYLNMGEANSAIGLAQTMHKTNDTGAPADPWNNGGAGTTTSVTSTVAGSGVNAAVIAYLTYHEHSAMNSGSAVGIYCDFDDGGKLKWFVSATSPIASFFFKLNFSGLFTNY